MNSAIERHVVVIGGGVIGMTVATMLLQRDANARVTVIERGAIGGGTSRYAGAIDIPYYQTPFHRDLVAFSWQWYRQQAAADAYRFAVPITWYVANEQDEADLRDRVIDDLQQNMSPMPAWHRPEGQIKLDGKAFVLRPEPWCQELAQQLQRSGRCELIQQRSVTALKTASQGVVVSCDNGETIEASHSIVCCGPWLPQWMGDFTAAQEIRNKLVCGLQIWISPQVREWRAVGWIDLGIFLLPYGKSGNYFMSVRHEEWDVTPDHVAPLPASVRERASEFLNTIVGEGNWSIVEPSVFMDTYSKDFVPVVKRLVSDDNRITLISGTHGSGVRLAPGLADLALQSCFAA